METLTVNKKMNVVKLYLSRWSHQEIATKASVSKGSVESIVTDLKAGVFPEVADLADQVTTLRALSIELKHAGKTPGQCGVGLAVLNRVNKCGLEVADIERWAAIIKIAGTEDKMKAFVAAIYRVQDFINASGLSLDEIEGKIEELKTKAAELQPTLDELSQKKQEIVGLEKKRNDLIPVIDNMEQKYKVINPVVADLQNQQSELVKQIKQEEDITASTQAALADWSKESQKMSKAGFTIETLTEFNDKVRVIAARHHIARPELRDRLLYELQILGKGLTLETRLKDIRAALKTEQQTLTLTKTEMEKLKASNQTLSEQKAKLEADIKANREYVIVEIGKIAPAARNMLATFAGELRQGNNEVLEVVKNLKDGALQTGTDIGRYQGIVEANQWLVGLLALVNSDEKVEPTLVRAILMRVLRGTQPWMKSNILKGGVNSPLLKAVDLLVSELQGWQV